MPQFFVDLSQPSEHRHGPVANHVAVTHPRRRDAIRQMHTIGPHDLLKAKPPLHDFAKRFAAELSVKALGGQLAEQPPISCGELPGVPEAPAPGYLMHGRLARLSSL